MYINSTDLFSASVYGLSISWKGEIIRDITSFIYATSQPDTGDIIWSLFTLPIPTNNRTINLMREGFIKNDGGSFVNFVAFLTAAGDYCLVVARSYASDTLSSTPMLDITLQIHLKLEAHFIYTTETGNTVPSVIYMSAIENLNVFAMNCDIEYSGLGNMCQLYFVNGLGVSTFPFTLSIVFHSSGSVDTAVSNDLELDIKATDYLVLDPLYYQGDLLTIHRPQETGNFIYGYVINATGHVVSNWTIPQPLQTNSTGNIYGILPNNIITYAMQTDVSNWTLNFEKLPEFTMLDDNGYFNPQINSTFPPINGTIPIRTNEVIINYKQAVTLSDGNISVFQLQDVYGDSLLRQTYSGNSDMTDQAVTEPYSATIKSILRLDPTASARFENLTSDGKVSFVNQLNHELAVCVPVDTKRFHSEVAYQYDPSITDKRILLPLTIFSAPINSSMIENSTDVFWDLDVLIRNSNLTLISRMNKTKSLDPSFGIIRARRIFTLLSFVDIYSLEVLCSKIGNSESLSAPFSRNIKVWIYWIGFVAFFKKDLSQLVLLVLYYSKTLHNDLIPLLSLIAAAAVVIFNGFWRIYLFTMFLYRKFYRRDRATKDDEPPIAIYNTENNS
ncbi:hypothetical protein C2G38_2045239 [Gigaspora rosea]|uniref:Uncharacterized protein n=1 Tax=Gigaspora rosea TaxID=44941 RepID=A0A397UDX3_9GLOM|nr:hypothetical protein C2G38_2045239 [Gigaspora rosea]